MIYKNFKRIRRAIWTWKQPLTKAPTTLNCPISDLFVWRNNNYWQTYFELIDIPALFEDSQLPRYAILVFMNSDGKIFLRHRIALDPHCRQTLDITSLIGSQHGEVGTFAVFHTSTPKIVGQCGSYLAERGYVSYSYRGAPLRSYVHGNLDAVTLNEEEDLHFLGGGSFLQRAYNLQYELDSKVDYEFGLVNPTSRSLTFDCQLLSLRDGKITSAEKLEISSGGVSIGKVKADKLGSKRLVIHSKLVMARPLVFRFQNFKLDVFHG